MFKFFWFQNNLYASFTQKYQLLLLWWRGMILAKRSRETIHRAELSGMRNRNLQRFIVKIFTEEWSLKVQYLGLCAFPIWYSFPLLRSNVTYEVIRVLEHATLWSFQQFELCSHFMHSDRTLPWHVWFLVWQMTMSVVLHIPVGPHSNVWILVMSHRRKE